MKLPRITSIAAISALGLSGLIALATPASAGTAWGLVTELSDDSNTAREVQLGAATDGSVVHALWKQYLGSRYQVQLRTSTDSGTTWGDVVEISDASQNSINADLAVSTDGNDIVASWRYYDTTSGSWIAAVAMSADAGGSWSAATDLSDSATSVYDLDVVMSADGSTVAAHWRQEDSVTGRNTARAIGSSDGGSTWHGIVDLSDPARYSSSPRLTMAPDTGAIHAIWPHRNASSQDVIQYSGSTDGGASWSSTIDLSDPASDARTAEVAVNVDGAEVAAAWVRSDGSNDIVQTRSSSDGGVTWTDDGGSDPAHDLSATGYDSAAPIVSVSETGTTQQVLWRQEESSARIIQHSSSGDNGISWSAATDLSDSDAAGIDHQIATSSDSGQLAALWIHRPDEGFATVKVRDSADAGDTWSTTTAELSDSTETSDDPVLLSSADGSTLHAAWEFQQDGKRVIRVVSGIYAEPSHAPRDATAVPGEEEIAVSWTTPVSDGGSDITGYRIQINDGSGWLDAITDTESIETSYTATGLTSEASYRFRIAAINGVSVSENSDHTAAISPISPAEPPESDSKSGIDEGNGSSTGNESDANTGNDAEANPETDSTDIATGPAKLLNLKVKTKKKRSGRVSYKIKFRLQSTDEFTENTSYQWRIKTKKSTRKASRKKSSKKWSFWSNWKRISPDSLTGSKKLKSKIKKIKKLRKAEPRTKAKIQARAINDVGSGPAAKSTFRTLG